MDKLSPDLDGRAGKPVPCPRCQSSNTKFCYYNNHNVNQPRHFCRDCQRYWTAGGSLRNVPVGAGKRKHKGLQGIPTKTENLSNIFAFHPDQGVFPPLDSPNVLSFKQHVASHHNYGESKTIEAPSVAMAQLPVNGETKPQLIPPVASASRAYVTGSYDAASLPQTRAYVCSSGPEKVGFTEARKQPSLALGLNFGKEVDAKEFNAPVIYPLEHTSPQNVGKQESRAPQNSTERDESTGCSSVTANLGPSVLEAAAESNNPTTKASTVSPFVEQAAPTVLNPMAAALGASMCPPWLWPFILGGRNIVPPGGAPQVDPAFAAMSAIASMSPINPALGAMASMSPMNPAFAAAVGAMASGARLSQVDPNVMAAFTASFLQFPQLWNPYTWGLPWNTAWNMTNAVTSAPSSRVMNAPNGGNKRPASPSQGQEGSASKSSKRDHVQEGSQNMHTSNGANVPTFSCPTRYFDAFQTKGEVSQLKTTPQSASEHLDAHEDELSPHSNPAAQARSAAFHEGN